MKIIGHRGAKGLALENTIESIRAAKKVGVDGIEIDVRLTSDNYLVLSHDKKVHRISDYTHAIDELRLDDLPELLLHNGETLPMLHAALKAADGTPVFIEAKGTGWAVPLAKFLRTDGKQFKNLTVIARDHYELASFQALMPRIPLYVVQRFNPIDVFQALQVGQQHHFTGIDLNFWLLNPLTYWLARRYKLDIVVYTVNSPLIARFLRRLFPQITITTDHPERMQFLRKQ